MEFDIQRQGVTPAVRPVPTDNTLAVLPMTADRVGRDLEDGENAAPVRINSTEDAFKQFRPKVHVQRDIGEAKFVVDHQINGLRDLEPDRVLTRTSPDQQNDLADLHGRIQILQQLRTRFAQPKVKKAWANEEQRQELIEAVRQFQQQITKIAEGK
jgi:hypothetical protein